MPTMPEGDYAPVPRQGWWNRNWKWAVPVGCLGLMGSCLCFVAIAIGYGYTSFRDMGAYTDALAQAQDDPQVQKALGSPFKPGFPSNTQVSTTNGRTHASFVVPLDGPKADGTLHAVADKDGESWTFRTLYVELAGGGRVDLLDTEAPDDARDALPEDLDPHEPEAPEPPEAPEDDVEPRAPAAPLPPPDKQPGRDSDIDL
ncbi:hypothetical protein D7Y13_31930 [Corallococcus praedator]|uniref:Cytochrome oxidase complex assembly protein 1 n=1 Tax=Corallococcus praedator TaxID=2316724 RepID=A0ABX9Q9G1_9BACT|nr:MULTISPECIES: cytochrome c oxidase assembly factor Coa1 family protein [Corallococcus]RKH04168.1 hypothetical protein D7X74_35610 [Corallococcus sp. CA047B]RKH22352.1 hypothetical protein D7X75_35645 [Corallococcus sp. CA031C]RKH95518.1 hypothetical protein D7Y13_31930 [Corallococcus praedator]